ncbi:hypothetical protein [Nostoc commune]|uniref:hypothetical protein n=1 Tax=Nostoc commune TaxID=1178 RepID=UPI0018C69F08|nr:hypothetical protein [Nostoc commune]MBG1262877.1 hypothetical protein [Nostoc commune BAE]
MLATYLNFAETDPLYEPEHTRSVAAAKLKVTVRTLSRYLAFGAEYIPALKAYLTDDGGLNGKRILDSHIKYLEEIQYLKLNYSSVRVSEILTKKYSPLEND